MARTIARWMNTDKTLGAMLSDNGMLSIIERENSGCVWSPPTALGLDGVTVDMSAVLVSLDHKDDWRLLDS